MFNRPAKCPAGSSSASPSPARSPTIPRSSSPTSRPGNLDLQTGKLIIELLRELNKESGVTIISATHDHKMLAVSDRILWIRDGRVDRIQRATS
jgi:putative ABC transport system ATP-binding protein